ncbi:CocE/NonD family hydrolase [Amycolatopsis magusensis]|uniref:CocE/NonD family hydrolase n=1 Tax=Amycolatopsis magusensis TaxID=882444 RepID=UPI001AE5F147
MSGRPQSNQGSADPAEAVEWLALQPWCTGRVDVLGVYFPAIAASWVVERRPAYLAAMMPWYGAANACRKAYRHDGIEQRIPRRVVVLKGAQPARQRRARPCEPCRLRAAPSRPRPGNFGRPKPEQRPRA